MAHLLMCSLVWASACVCVCVCVGMIACLRWISYHPSLQSTPPHSRRPNHNNSTPFLTLTFPPTLSRLSVAAAVEAVVATVGEDGQLPGSGAGVRKAGRRRKLYSVSLLMGLRDVCAMVDKVLQTVSSEGGGNRWALGSVLQGLPSLPRQLLTGQLPAGCPSCWATGDCNESTASPGSEIHTTFCRIQVDYDN